jgi:hypothetical protein
VTQPVSVKTIPVAVQEELLALGILQRELDQTHAAVVSRQNSIIEKLTGRTMDSTLMRDLVAEHNRRAVKIQRGSAVRA